MTRILLYSDEPILAKGLESVLRQVEGFDLLPTCGSVSSLMEQMTLGSPDLVLMDLTPEITFAVLSGALITSSIIFLKPVFILPFAMDIAITGFEAFVAILQAFIFTTLAATYIADSLESGH